uniref:Uncharacterized protein n=1 Tax=Anguilla anguilla TaxID=7936 RepID=A0A0E9RK53_ANGAN
MLSRSSYQRGCGKHLVRVNPGTHDRGELRSGSRLGCGD